MIAALLLAATVVREPSTGFELTVPDSLPCIFVPPTPMPEACGELPAAQREGLAAAFMFATDVERGVLLFANLNPADGLGVSGPSGIDLYVDHFASQAPGGARQTVKRDGHSYELIEGGDVPMARFELAPPGLAIKGLLVPVKRDVAVTVISIDRDGKGPDVGDAVRASIRVRDPVNVQEFGKRRFPLIVPVAAGALVLAIALRAAARWLKRVS